MFDNIGGKMKSLAKVVCWIGIISCVISGFVMTVTDEDLTFLGIVIIVIGSLVSWVSSFAVYGFGQLIENTDQLVQCAKDPTTNKSKQETLSKDSVDEIYI